MTDCMGKYHPNSMREPTATCRECRRQHVDDVKNKLFVVLMDVLPQDRISAARLRHLVDLLGELA